MRRVHFALTTLDVQMVQPIPMFDDPMVPAWTAAPLSQVPVVRLFGVTAQGASVCAHVHGFRPFFLAELSKEVAALLQETPACSSATPDSQRSCSISKLRETAEAIEAAMARAGRSKARVLGLRLEQRCSIYGLHLDPSTFLRVDVADYRDVETAAGVLQSGGVPLLGCPQAHEAHLPFLLHFLAEHHLCGAGAVRVCGEVRDSGCGPHAKQTSCTIELDVSSPDGISNHGDYMALLGRAGESREERARFALRAMLDSSGSRGPAAHAKGLQERAVTAIDGTSSEKENVDQPIRRPTPGARTTPLQVRRSIRHWLQGGEPPADQHSAWMPRDMPASGASPREMEGIVQDIEDLAIEPMRAMTPGATSQQSTGCDLESLAKEPCPPPGYSDPRDDPRIAHHQHLDNCRAAVALSAPELASGYNAKAASAASAPVSSSTGVGAACSTKDATKPTDRFADGGQWVPHEAAHRTSLHTGAAQPTKYTVQSGLASSSTAMARADVEWEDVCAVFSLEVLCVGAKGEFCKSESFNPMANAVAAVVYVSRPHSCQLGGQRLRRADQHGAIVVAKTPHEAAEWEQSSQTVDWNSLQIVDSETALFDKLASIVKTADPDLCLGWELRSGSWGFLMQRAKFLGRSNLRSLLSRAPMTSAPHLVSAQRTPETSQKRQASDTNDNAARSSSWRPRESSDPRTYDSEMIAPTDLQFTGRLVLNVWRVLMHLTFGAKLRSYAPQEAAKELLGFSLPHISSEELSHSWCSGGISGQHAVIEHLQRIANLSIQVFDVLEVLPRAAELSRLFGMDILSGFTRGTQLRVESLLTRVARASGFALLSASHAQVRSQPALECLPLVMEPFSGFYWDPVLVFDFKGMYPSLIVGYNISFDTCLGRARRASAGPSCSLGVRDQPWLLSAGGVPSLASYLDDHALTDAEVDSAVRLLPGDVLFAAPDVRRGLLPLMLAEVIRLRAEAKVAMKTATPAATRRLNQRQFALKYFANVTYGYAGASFSGRMPCAEIADAIVATGRRALEEAASIIESSEPSAKVIYGDTDSIFVQLRGSNLEEAFTIGHRLCKAISARHPSPVELEFEKVYMPCLCLSKKRYCGLAYNRPPSDGGEPQFEAKGIEAVRRDQCRLTSNLQGDLLKELFWSKDMSAVKRIFMQRVSELLRGGVSGPPLTDLVFLREARLGTYRAEDEDGGSATLPPQAAVAHNRMAVEGEMAAPEFGERVAYVVSCGPSGARLLDRCVAPTEVAEGGSMAAGSPRLDRWWYAEKAILPAVTRIFHNDLCGLPPVDVAGWLRQVPRPCNAGFSKNSGALSRLLRRMCSSCRNNEASPGIGICKECLSPAEAASAKDHMRRSRAHSLSLQQACASCAGPQLWRSCTAAAHCPALSQRLAAEEQLHLAEEDLRFLGVDTLDDVVLVSDSEPCSDDGQVTQGIPSMQHDAPVPHPTQSESSETNNCFEAGMHDVGTILVSDDEGGLPENGVREVARSSTDMEGVVTEAASGSSAMAAVAPAAHAAPAANLPLCSGHNEPCKELEVKKDGPNIGRHFFACARPREEQCNFFAWADRRIRATSAAVPLPRAWHGPEQNADAGADLSTPPATPRRKSQAAQTKAGASTTRTPQKRRRPVSKDGRLERYVPAPSKQVSERIVRALEHRLLLISAKVDAQGAVIASVLGHTGNVYDMYLGTRVRCTCLDFTKAQRACKHLLFVMLRVLRIPQDDPRLWQRAFLPREVRDLRERLEQHVHGPGVNGVQAPDAVVSALAAADQSTPVVRHKLGEACPICFDPVATLAGSAYCERCGRNLHNSCAEQWRAATSATGSTCPRCQADSAGNSDSTARANARVAPGQPLPRQVNLAAVSELHAQPATLEETYPSTHQWIARRAQSSSALPANAPSSTSVNRSA